MLIDTVWRATDKKCHIFSCCCIFSGPLQYYCTSSLGNRAALLARNNAERIFRKLCSLCPPTEKLPVGLCLFVFLLRGVLLLLKYFENKTQRWPHSFQRGIVLEAPVGLRFPFVPSGLLQAMCLVAESAFWKTIHWKIYGWPGHVVVS